LAGTILRFRKLGSAAAAVLVPAAVLTAGAGQAGAAASPGVISTVAGGAGGPARATSMPLGDEAGSAPCGVAFGAGGVLVADGGTVRTINPKTDWLTTPAGTGQTLPGTPDGHSATGANLYTCAVAADKSGNLVVMDTQHERLRVVAARGGTFYGRSMTAGAIYTVAGNGKQGFSGDGGPAVGASLGNPQGVAVDGSGNLVIADSRNQRIRVVAVTTGTFYGQPMTAGHIYTVAGNGTEGSAGDGGPAISAELDFPRGVTVDHAGNLVICDSANGIRVVAAKTGTFYGQPMTAGDIYAAAPGLGAPKGAVVDSAGNLISADAFDNEIRVWAATTGTFYGVAMTAGNSYTVAGHIYGGYSGDGGPAIKAKLDEPRGVAIDSSGNLVIADYINLRIRVIANTSGTFYGQPMTAGDIYTVAGGVSPGYFGAGVPATRALLRNPRGVAVDGAGDMLIADTDNQRVRVVAAHSGSLFGMPVSAGDIYTVAGGGTQGLGDGGPATNAQLSSPAGAATDGAGNLLIADTGESRIRAVAAQSGTFYGQAMTAGDIYTVAGGGTQGLGDGGPATSAELNAPETLAVDGAGNLVIADSNNGRIRVVAAKTGTFYGQAMTAGDIYTVSAALAFPAGVAVDGAGNLVVADTNHWLIRVVAAKTGTFYGQAMTAGHTYTVAGNGIAGFAGDGGPATQAELFDPWSVAVDGTGNLVIADTDNERIRVVAAKTGTFYGQAMTAGDIYSVAGQNSLGFSGDGGPGTKAHLSSPIGIAVDPAGNILTADLSNNRIREVHG
jgi:sugar lactone lactonase YvrE